MLSFIYSVIKKLKKRNDIKRIYTNIFFFSQKLQHILKDAEDAMWLQQSCLYLIQDYDHNRNMKEENKINHNLV